MTVSPFLPFSLSPFLPFSLSPFLRVSASPRLRVSPSVHKPIAHRDGDGFGFGMDLEFVVDISDVELDRVVGNVELFGRGYVVVSLDQKLEKTCLVWRQ